MGLPPRPRFGYDCALGRPKTHVLYELREKQNEYDRDVAPGGGVSSD
jgi:hypothetical protein